MEYTESTSTNGGETEPLVTNDVDLTESLEQLDEFFATLNYNELAELFSTASQETQEELVELVDLVTTTTADKSTQTENT